MIDKEQAIVQTAAVLYATGETAKEACDKAELLIDELQGRGYVRLDEMVHTFQVDGEPVE